MTYLEMVPNGDWEANRRNFLTLEELYPTIAALTSRVSVLETRPRIQAYRNGAVNHSSTGNWQAVSLDTTDFGSGFTLSGGNLVCTRAGIYTVSGAVGLAANAVGNRGARVYVNGNPKLSGAFAINAGGVNGVFLPVCGEVNVAVNDTVELWGFQSSGGNLAYLVGSGPVGTFLSIG